MPKYKVIEEIEHQGVRYCPGDVVELSDRQAEFHGVAQSLVEPEKPPQFLKKHGDIGLALTRSEEQSGDSRQP